ncbi:MAG: LuxR C-terminal-related transcriptional regulator [Roseibium sp.]
MTIPAHHIDACLASLGKDDFARAFCDLVETLGFDQVMVFSIGPAQASCLLSRHFSKAALAGRLAARYLDGWYRRDPLLPELLAAPAGTVTVRRLEQIAHGVDEDYRRIFFEAPGLLSKTTLIAAGDRLRLFVSLYRTGETAETGGDDLALVAGRLALLHFERRARADTPEPLAVLSDRERAVCLGILSGRKAEAIASDMGIAASTVVTYRKRAYEKLGITSRASLFAICGRHAWLPDPGSV